MKDYLLLLLIICSFQIAVAQDLNKIFSNTYNVYKNSKNLEFKFTRKEYNYYSKDTNQTLGWIAFSKNSDKNGGYDFYYFTKTDNNDEDNSIKVLYDKDTFRYQYGKNGIVEKAYIKSFYLNKYNWRFSIPDILQYEFNVLNPQNYQSKNIEKYTINITPYLDKYVYDIVIYHKTKPTDDISNNVERFLIDTVDYRVYYYAERFNINHYDLMNFSEIQFEDIYLANKSEEYTRNARFDNLFTMPINIVQPQVLSNEKIDYKNYPLHYSSDSTIRLVDLKGKYVLLDFWYASCFYCLKQFSDINKILNRYQSSDDLVFVGINHIDNDVIRKKIEDKLGLKFTTYLSSDEFNQSLNVNSYPTIIILDRELNIVYRHSGYDDKNYDQKLSKIIDNLLK